MWKTSRGLDVFREKYEIIKNAIEAEKYQYSAAIAEEVRSEFGITDEIVIGHVGNFTPAKNHIFMLEIFQKIQKKECKIKMIFVGGGERINNIRKKCMRWACRIRLFYRKAIGCQSANAGNGCFYIPIFV